MRANNMDHTNFAGANLNEAAIMSISCEGLILHDALLMSAEITKSTLKDADFSGSDLREADINLVSLENCSFRGCDMRRVDLRNSSIMGCDFSGANIEGIKYDQISLNILARSSLEGARIDKNLENDLAQTRALIAKNENGLSG